MEPTWYMRARCYERTLTAVATLLVERGLVSRDYLEQRAGGQIPLSKPVAALPELQKEDSVARQPRLRISEERDRRIRERDRPFR